MFFFFAYLKDLENTKSIFNKEKIKNKEFYFYLVKNKWN